MTLAIDASNIRIGGGLTHLIGILSEGNPSLSGFEKVIIFSNNNTLKKLPSKEWLIKESHPYLNRSSFFSFYFQAFILSKVAKEKYNSSIVFAPGGTFIGRFSPFVTMSRNMLPFELEEAFRFKSWKTRLRFITLFFTQSFTYKKSNGVIFLTRYALDVITKKIRLKSGNVCIIPHGIDRAFSFLPKEQKHIRNYNSASPFTFLYVSIITEYKHQWNVASAILKLHSEGFPVTLDLIGPISRECEVRITKLLKSEKNKNNTVIHLGSVEHDDLSKYYQRSDAFVFASSCENMPNILLEAMTAGLPIACSSKGPMPEVLGNGGLYFDPLDTIDIYNCLKRILIEKNTREEIAQIAYNRTENYTWTECSKKTFQFLFEKAKNKL